MIKDLFSFQGSMDRKTFLKYSVIMVVIAVLLKRFFASEIDDSVHAPFGIIGLAFMWIWLALFVKRGRALSIWWLWSALLAIIFNLITWVVYLVMGKK
ncbi:MAG: hypothetical protein LBG46_02395 [Elusimicrobiota bacterium]|jgi:uncharacterized membrane protein YhaH (DUF805 family)|nr:hypothetical protein [Elusimicrobiota bacterium]